MIKKSNVRFTIEYIVIVCLFYVINVDTLSTKLLKSKDVLIEDKLKMF